MPSSHTVTGRFASGVPKTSSMSDTLKQSITFRRDALLMSCADTSIPFVDQLNMIPTLQPLRSHLSTNLFDDQAPSASHARSPEDLPLYVPGSVANQNAPLEGYTNGGGSAVATPPALSIAPVPGNGGLPTATQHDAPQPRTPAATQHDAPQPQTPTASQHDAPQPRTPATLPVAVPKSAENQRKARKGMVSENILL